MKLLTLLYTATLALGLTTSLYAADAGMEATGGNLSKKDLNFVTMAAQGGMYEVTAGELAQKKAVAGGTKHLGEMIVQDHTKANAELKKIATSKGVTLPTMLSRKQAATLEKLSKKEGTDFDVAYVEAMEADHKEDIALFEKQAKDGEDPELRAFAAKTLPVLQKHKQHVDEAKGKK